MNKILVIGGGASGLMAAAAAAGAGASVTLLERNEKLGKKIYITGKGRCNATNDCDPETFRRNVPKNPRFLYSALDTFPPRAMIDWLESRGCPTVTERGQRVYPASQKASDVTRAFERELRRLGVTVRLNTRAESLLMQDGAVRGVRLESGETLSADAVILCTGGRSYPSTGSDGDGWRLLRECGHTVFPAMPSLVGLESGEEWIRGLQGLSLKNVKLTLAEKGKKRWEELGEMLFTHFGISGPLVLTASSYLAEADFDEVSLALNLKPGLTAEQLDARVLRDIAAAPRRQNATLLRGLFPERLADCMAALCGIDPAGQAGALRREERARLVTLTQALPLPVTGPRPLEEAIVTRGGLSVKEVNASTMESRLVRGLYIAGEMLDVDALTGGFNLHIAFSTGYLAGLSAAE